MLGVPKEWLAMSRLCKSMEAKTGEEPEGSSSMSVLLKIAFLRPQTDRYQMTESGYHVKTTLLSPFNLGPEL